MRTALAIFMFLHGVAHVPGFAVPWRLLHSPDLPYRTTIAGGTLDLGDTGIRVYGLLWLLLALAFTGVAAQLLLRAPSFNASLIGVAVASTLLCLLSLPEARIGLAVNAVILAVALTVAKG